MSGNQTINNELGYQRPQREWQPFTLPSLGHNYGSALPGGEVHIARMTGQDEIALNSQTMDGYDRVGSLLASCVRLPSGFEYELAGIKFVGHSGLLSSDANALLMGIRNISVGLKYSAPWRCPGCRTQQRTPINLAEAVQFIQPDVVAKRFADHAEKCKKDGTENTWGPLGVEPYECLLKDEGVTLQLRHMRRIDEKEAAALIRRIHSEHQVDASKQVIRAQHIVNVDKIPTWGSWTLERRAEWVRLLSLRDGLLIENTIDRRETGAQGFIDVKCNTCATPSKVEVAMDAEFFRPSDI